MLLTKLENLKSLAKPCINVKKRQSPFHGAEIEVIRIVITVSQQASLVLYVSIR